MPYLQYINNIVKGLKQPKHVLFSHFNQNVLTHIIMLCRLEGVFMRCLLNIWGVMLFLRLTWVIGQAGLVEGLLVITLCNIVTIITG